MPLGITRGSNLHKDFEGKYWEGFLFYKVKSIEKSTKGEVRLRGCFSSWCQGSSRVKQNHGTENNDKIRKSKIMNHKLLS